MNNFCLKILTVLLIIALSGTMTVSSQEAIVAVSAKLKFDGKKATITWGKGSKNISGYNIYRIPIKQGWDDDAVVMFCQEWVVKADGSTVITARNPDPIANAHDAAFLLNKNPITATSFVDTTIETGKEYIYFIQALGATKKGEISPGSWKQTLLSMKTVRTRISHAGGYYNHPIELELTSSVPAQIYYTIDGTAPHEGSPNNASTVLLQLDEDTTVKYFARDLAGNKEEVETAVFAFDNDPPEIMSVFPSAGLLVATQGKPLTFLATFGDANSGINVSATKLLDKYGNDITSDAKVDKDSLSFTIENPPAGTTAYTLLIEDTSGNILTKKIIFTVDPIIPSTWASFKGRKFAAPFTVDLETSESATIYYSTDGYPPFAGAKNTKAVASPVKEIDISNTTVLQFFAVDSAGNKEATQKEIYYFDELHDSVVNLQVSYHEHSKEVVLTWDPLAGFHRGYSIYRVTNISEEKIINSSRTGRYWAPQRLKLSNSIITDTVFNDSKIVSGGTYRYGITVVNEKGVEGLVSNLASVKVIFKESALDKKDAIARSVAWLESTQNKLGCWGDTAGHRMLATSQVLNAFNFAKRDNAGIRQAVFYLRGRFADNNDFLSRKILTLNRFGHNTDEMVNRLLSQGTVDHIRIVGWGLQKMYKYDAIDTALGAMAAKCTKIEISHHLRGGEDSLKTDKSLKSPGGYYGWVPEKDTNVYVSSLVYNAIKAKPETYTWITGSQNANGSFGGGLVDTAAALLWLDMSDDSRLKAVQYLVAQQGRNGAWLEDPYLTGLCLEALLK